MIAGSGGIVSAQDESSTHVVLEVVALSDHEWRVCDGRVAASDATRVLAFIDKTGQVYELVRLQNGPRSEIFDSFDAAIDALEPAMAEGVTP